MTQLTKNAQKLAKIENFREFLIRLDVPFIEKENGLFQIFDADTNKITYQVWATTEKCHVAATGKWVIGRAQIVKLFLGGVNTIQVSNILRLTLAAICDSDEISEEAKELIRKAIPVDTLGCHLDDFVTAFIDELNHENGGDLTREQMMAKVIFYSSVFNAFASGV